jgi:hypothetical protein
LALGVLVNRTGLRQGEEGEGGARAGGGWRRRRTGGAGEWAAGVVWMAWMAAATMTGEEEVDRRTWHLKKATGRSAGWGEGCRRELQSDVGSL